MKTFGLYSKYYDLFYDGKDTDRECRYAMDLLKKYSVEGKRWIEFGAGSGRHGEVFVENGICWSGVEISSDMAKIGQEKGLAITIADIGMPFKTAFHNDAVLTLFHVVSYLTNNENLKTAFANAYLCLKPGGLFLFDIWYSPCVYTQKPEKRTKEVESNKIHVVRKATPTIDWNTNTVNVHYEIIVTDKTTKESTSFSEDHLMRHFSLPELKLFASQIGFEFLHAEEWLTAATPSDKTWGVCCLLKKMN